MLEEMYKQKIEQKIVAELKDRQNKEILAAQQKVRQEEQQKYNTDKEKLIQEKNDLLKQNSELQQVTSKSKKLEIELQEKSNLINEIQMDNEEFAKKIKVQTKTEMQAEFDKKLKAKDDFYDDQMKQREEHIKEEAQRIAKRDYEIKEINNERKYKQELENKEQDMEQKFELKLREKDEIISQMQKNIDKAQKSSNQGSMQVQGEAQEKFLLEMLQELFPNDIITQKTTGKTEADIKQVIIDKIGYQNVECGIIQYESKNTQSWSNVWIDKLIADGENSNADVLVLVTQTMPANNKDLHRIKNVWVCPIKDIKLIVYTLRYGLIENYKAKGSQINKADKMERLFDFMMSPTFKNYIENIYSGIERIKQSNEKEKKAFESMCKKREKQCEIIMSSCINLISTMQGIGIETLEIDALNLKLLAEENEILLL